MPITRGCHRGAVDFYKDGNELLPVNSESAIVFHRIVEFMQKCGTSFNFTLFKLDDDLVYSNESKEDFSCRKLLNLYDKLATKTSLLDSGQSRSMHLRNTIFTAKDNKRYLNLYHQQLCQVDTNDNDCILTVQNRNPQRITPKQRQAIQLMQSAFVFAMVWMIYNKYSKKPSLESCNSFRSRFLLPNLGL